MIKERKNELEDIMFEFVKKVMTAEKGDVTAEETRITPAVLALLLRHLY